MEKIISNTEISAILGVTETAQIELWNEASTEILANLLQIREFGTHTVTDEKIQVFEGTNLIVKDFPIDFTQTITIKDTLKQEFEGYTFEQENDFLRTIRVLDENGNPTHLGILIDYQQHPTFPIFIDYTAGYTLQGTITLATNPSASETITVTQNGVPTTYTFVSGTPSTNQIAIGATADDTASNLATAIGGTASTNEVTMALGQKASGVGTIVNPGIPQDLKNAVAFMVGGAIAQKSQLGGIKSLKIDDKSVTFANESEASFVQNVVNKYSTIEILAV